MFGIFKAVHNFDYFRYHKFCFALSIYLCVATAVVLPIKGLNYGVDFAGGILM